MSKKWTYDASVIGSGPNGLSAAISLAQAGLSVVVYEASETIGGGMRSANVTLPGFVHDICSAIYPLAASSPFFKSLHLEKHGLEWIYPPASLAHPFEDGDVALLETSIEKTGRTLGIDFQSYKSLMDPLIENWDLISTDLLGPFQIFPKHPLKMAQFGLLALQSAERLLKKRFTGKKGQAFFAGLAAHSILPLDRAITASFALVLAILGHKGGWPLAKGGSQKIADALVSVLQGLGGKIITGVKVQSLKELPPSRLILCDTTPKQLLQIAPELPEHYKKRLKKYRYGPGVFKIDWALNNPIPWKNPACLKAATIHLGETFEEIALSEKEVWENRNPQKPFVLLAQQSLFDPSRAPEGKHTAWGYCHVPNGSIQNMTETIEKQIERFAPNFRDCILARSVKNTKDIESWNNNCVGGDIVGGVQDIYQLFTRPLARIDPYSTPLPGLYICSSSSPPGGGVHGLCGYHAAQAALKWLC